MDYKTIQKYYNDILSTIKERKSYYVGGTLCVDHNDAVLLFNLNETVCESRIVVKEFIESDKSVMYNLSIPNVKLLFSIYKEHKGETEYYKEKFNESCIRHLN
jgi:hypothetical protein